MIARADLAAAFERAEQGEFCGCGDCGPTLDQLLDAHAAEAATHARLEDAVMICTELTRGMPTASPGWVHGMTQAGELIRRKAAG